MKYPCFRLSQGRTALANHKHGGENPFSSVAVEYRSAAGDIDAEDVEEALREIGAIATPDEAEMLRGSGLSADQVEGTIAVGLYPLLSEFPPEALGDPDFWRYLAVEVVRDFVFWRDGQDCSPASFGLSSARRIPDCVPLRMFNRAHIVHESFPAEHEKQLRMATAGGADFWQSHILRVQSRFDPRVADEFAEALRVGGIPNVQVLRQVAKDVRRLRANLVLELQESDALKGTLMSVVSGAAEPQ